MGPGEIKETNIHSLTIDDKLGKADNSKDHKHSIPLPKDYYLANYTGALPKQSSVLKTRY